MIELKNITKKYGEKIVYNNFNLSVENGKITTILGESGSGKTTLLNIIAGITNFTGEILGGVKPVSFVFQRDRLINNLTVKENLKLVAPHGDIEKALTDIGLKDSINSYPKQLSAGMARRVAIVRAFLFDSSLVLMDEPFVNLDLSLKCYLIDAVKKMCKEQNKTVITVTHDIKEATMIADRIVVLSHGSIVYDNSHITSKTERELYKIMTEKYRNGLI